MKLLNFLCKSVTIFGHLPNENIIIASNHHSYIDPFIYNSLKENVKLLAHEYVMKLPFKKFLKRYGFIKASILNGIDALKDGNSVAICPTGLIEITGEDILPYRRGIIIIARESKIPIVPIYVSYSKYPGKWIKMFSIYFGNIILILTMPFWRSHVTVNIGKPYYIASNCDIQKETIILKEKVLALARSSKDSINSGIIWHA